MEHREALFILNMLPLIGPGKRRLLEDAFGSLEAAFAAERTALCKIPGIGEKLAEILHNWREYCNFEEELRMCRDAQVAIITDEDDVYPPLLREIHDPPICLYVKGSLDVLRSQMCIGIVGSRNATMYGMRMAANLATGACMAGWPVVSGLARGIDTAAHDATLRSGGRTVAVIGSGLLRVYPQENVGLANRIVSNGGAVISEFQMCYQPDKRSFPMRNRIISGMCKGTIVVEAGFRSGSLITAATALDQGRTVFAVPGMADAPSSHGCHALIRDGAVLVESFQDVIEEFSGLPGLARPPKENQANPLPQVDVSQFNLSGLEMQIWRLVKEGLTDVDELIDRIDNAVPCIMAAIMTLQLKRLIRQLPGRRLAITEKQT